MKLATGSDADFALNSAIPLLNAAYTHDCPKPPEGWSMVRPIDFEEEVGSAALSRLCPPEKIGSHIGYIATKDDRCVVVFRGTYCEAEWECDANFLLTPLSPLIRPEKVEEGFFDIYRAAQASAIERLPNHFNSITVIGHSLGGALAQLFSYDLVRTRVAGANLQIYTFGSPRVGNAAFAKSLDQYILRNYRIVNHGDIVPSVPLELMGFRHAGIAVEVKGDHDLLDFKSAHRLPSYGDGLKKLMLRLAAA